MTPDQRDLFFAIVVALLTTAFVLNALRLANGRGWAAPVMVVEAIFLLVNLDAWLGNEDERRN